ncbi:MAG: exopolysaccharide biosynthesis polyprenyl glycosylphosphotransferase [Pricia sp.]
MLFKQGKVSGIITTTSFITDLLIINLFVLLVSLRTQIPILFHIYISLGWIIISVKNKYYEIYSYTRVTSLLIKSFTQFTFFLLILYSFIGFFRQPFMSRLELAQYFGFVFVAITIFKVISYLLLIRFRQSAKSNMRRVVIIGQNKKMSQLIEVFNTKTEFGFLFMKQFNPRDKNFKTQDCFDYVEQNKIDEIYCSVSELSDNEITDFVDFADNNLKTLKFLPDNRNIFAKKLKFEYYDYLPILSLRNIPLHNTIDAFVKRSFDIIFSLMVIFGLLIWLGPIIAFLISLESKGPVFYIQKRTGFDNREFLCFKFRSMRKNDDINVVAAVKNDMRVTKIGKFIRKTSIDELPQFYNVLYGNMSVVGPRPHPINQTIDYRHRIDKYMLRHFIKPGITGLAQIKGYRGEVENDSDIQNRIKLDIFYVENWSFMFDLKIIIQTVLNVFKGEDKAY